MERFRIVQTDSTRYRDQILAFWEQYLPGTPPRRFEWLNQGNPAGPAIWFFALDAKSDELAGVITIMPKDIIMNGRTVRAGILGDFMIRSKFRAFGPNLMLPRAALSYLKQFNIDLVYTLPNPDSETTIKRIGFTHAGVLHSIVKPLQTGYYLGRYFPSLPRFLLSPVADFCLKMIAREHFVSDRGVFEEVSAMDERADALWRKTNFHHRYTVGNHTSQYIGWRYLASPLYKYRVMTYRDPSAADLLGLIVFTMQEGKLHIADVVAVDNTAFERLLKRVIAVGRRERCLSLNMEVFDSHPLRRLLRSFGFADARRDSPVYVFPGQSASLSACWFLGGDRNL